MPIESKNHYKTLQVDPTAEHEVILAAFRRLALKYHPDTNKSPDAKRRMQEMNLAFEILSDSRKRALYDAERSSQNAKPKKAEQKAAKPDSEVIVRDGTFIAYTNGVVYDKKTGLEWFAGPDRNTDWYEAKEWVESLNVAGGGWRMPTKEELKTLYQKGAGTRNMTPLLKTTGWRVWSGETRDLSSAWAFNFSGGFYGGGWGLRGSSNNYDGRGFAVRSRRQ
jgi:curved DNA-binding protein CbpA